MKKKLKILAAAACVLTLSLTLMTGCGEDSGGSEGAITLKAGMGVNKEDCSYYLCFEKFKEIVEEKTDGEIQVEVYSDGTLGDERDLVEGCQGGTVDICVTATGPLASFIEEINVLNLPFLFDDLEHEREVLNSGILDAFNEDYEAAGLKNLGYMEVGFRNVINNKQPIEELGDCKGIKIRTLENDIMVSSYKALGFEVTPMALSEVVTSLQNGTINGVDNPLTMDTAGNYHELCDYLTLTEVIMPLGPVTMSLDTWNSLSEEQQKIVQEAMAEAIQWQHEDNEAKIQVAYDEMKEYGTQIVDQVKDKDKWLDAVQPVYDEYADIIDQDVLKQIEDLKK